MSAVGDVFEVSAVGSAFNQRILLTHHYIVTAQTGAVTDGQARSALLNAIGAQAGGLDVLETKYRQLLPNAYTLEAWRVQKIAPLRTVYQTETRTVQGMHMGNTETSNQAAVITLRTELAGRSQVSNKHIGPIPQDITVQADGLVTNAYKLLLETFGAALLTTIVTVAPAMEFFPCIYHRSAVPNTSPLWNQTVQTTLRVMRRRTVRVGE